MNNANPITRFHLCPPSPHRKYGSHGILTVCPSTAAFAIALGPTNPQMIVIAEETLGFRRSGLSPDLRLLVPTFSLRTAPVALTGQPSLQMRTLSYRAARSAEAPNSKYQSSKQISNPKFQIANRKTGLKIEN